jgi:hypothetical protein
VGGKKGFIPDQIIVKLREAEDLMNKIIGADACRKTSYPDELRRLNGITSCEAMMQHIWLETLFWQDMLGQSITMAKPLIDTCGDLLRFQVLMNSQSHPGKYALDFVVFNHLTALV